MTGRERHNEYFIPGDGISREVIQADICRYLGNDALVRPGNHNGRPGFFIRAYRNLTSEMIADLKADSARWEADVSRRADLQGSYSQSNHLPGNYHPQAELPTSSSPYQNPARASSTSNDGRQSQGRSPPPSTQTTVQPQSYIYPPHSHPHPHPHSQSPHTGSYGSPYTSGPYSSGTASYLPPQVSYPGSSQPIVTAVGHPSSYIHAPHAPTDSYNEYESMYYDEKNAPRFPGPGYEQHGYSLPSTGGPPPYTAASDSRIYNNNPTDHGRQPPPPGARIEHPYRR